MEKKRSMSFIFAIISILFWSTVATIFKITLKVLPYSLMVLYSSIVSVLIFLTYNLFKRNDLFEKGIFNSIFLGFLNPFLYYLLLFKGYDLLPAQNALILNYTWPIFITLFSTIFLGQKLKIVSIISFILALFGIYIIVVNRGAFHFNIYSLYPLLSAVVWGIYWNLNVKDKRKNEVKLFWNFFFSTFFIILFLIFTKVKIVFPMKGLLGSAYIGLFEMGITFLFWLYALKLAKKTSNIAILVYISPFLSLFWISIILKETIKIKTIIGFIIILLAIFLENYKILLRRK
ncbi:DMT family transporter [bacterium]|nr:DMT family transporter [bacterium]